MEQGETQEGSQDRIKQNSSISGERGFPNRTAVEDSSWELSVRWPRASPQKQITKSAVKCETCSVKTHVLVWLLISTTWTILLTKQHNTEQRSRYRHARALTAPIISDRHLRIILARANLRVSEASTNVKECGSRRRDRHLCVINMLLLFCFTGHEDDRKSTS